MEHVIVLYDADCGFCRWALDTSLAWDRHRRLRPVPLQSSEADRLLPGMDHEARMRSWHIVTPEGRVRSAGAAAPPLFRALPGGSPLAALADTFPRTTQRLYHWVTRHRDGLAKLVGAKACAVDPGRRRAAAAP